MARWACGRIAARNPAPWPILSSSFQRKLESSLDFLVKCRASTRPAAERVAFFSCEKKVTKETHPGRHALRASCPPGARMRYGGSLTVHPCTAANDRASCAVPFGLDPPRIRRALRGPVGRHPAAETTSRAGELLRTHFPRRSAWMHGFVHQSAVRGAEHRRLGGNRPKGRRNGLRRLRSSTWTYCLSNPAKPRSAGQSDSLTRIGPPRPVLDLFGYFLGQCQKVTRSTKWSEGLCLKADRRKSLDSSFRWNDEQNNRSGREQNHPTQPAP